MSSLTARRGATFAAAVSSAAFLIGGITATEAGAQPSAWNTVETGNSYAPMADAICWNGGRQIFYTCDPRRALPACKASRDGLIQPDAIGDKWQCGHHRDRNGRSGWGWKKTQGCITSLGVNGQTIAGVREPSDC